MVASVGRAANTSLAVLGSKLVSIRSRHCCGWQPLMPQRAAQSTTMEDCRTRSSDLRIGTFRTTASMRCPIRENVRYQFEDAAKGTPQKRWMGAVYPDDLAAMT